MRQPVTVIIQPHAIDQARLYAAGRTDSEAVQHVLEDYPRLVADVRQMRSRLAQLDAESAGLDALVSELQQIARRVLDL